MVYMYIIQRSNKRNIIFYQSGAELDSDRGGSSGSLDTISGNRRRRGAL